MTVVCGECGQMKKRDAFEPAGKTNFELDIPLTFYYLCVR